MAEAILIGLDFGTGGAKVLAATAEGQVLHTGYEEYPQFHDRPRYSEHDAGRYWDATMRLLGDAVRALGSCRHDVAAIGVSCALPSLVVVDGSGEPIARAINLMDRRATAEVDAVKGLVGEDVLLRVSGNRVEDHPGIVNLLWMKQHRPELWERIAKALTIDGFVTMRLTGCPTLNRSSAAFMGVAYDLRRCEFDESILAAIGIPRDKLPELVDCDEVVGQLRAEVADRLGLPAGVKVVGGQVDCNAAWIGGGATKPGDFQINLGTCGVIGVVHEEKSFIDTDAGRLAVNIPYTTDVRNVYSAVAVTMTGGQVLRYLRDVIGGIERSAAGSLGIDAYDLLTLEASKVPVGCEGLLALPYFMGERTPLWDASARAAYVGLSLHHGRGHLIRAMLEGVAYALRWALDVVRSGDLVVKEPLVFNEGGARSELWRRVVTDVLGVETAVLARGGGAALGDAILAGVGTGVLPDFQAASRFCEIGQHLVPDRSVSAVYDEGYRTFKEVYQALRAPLGGRTGTDD